MARAEKVLMKVLPYLLGLYLVRTVQQTLEMAVVVVHHIQEAVTPQLVVLEDLVLLF
jgi:hypothetical protein